MELRVRRLSEFSPREYEAVRRLLPAERLRQIDRIATLDDRRRSVLGEVLARQMLEAHTGIPAQDIIITYGPTGKPYTSGACFSISHSGNFAACAVDGRPVGIDLETTRPLDLRLAPACCTPAERAHLAALPLWKRGYQLLSLWVLKEAAIKCLGEDLRQMSRHEFSICSDGNIISSDQYLDCRLYRYPTCFLAVCRQVPPSS